ncbi:MAG: Gfo/Idh/MocA family oxidoreductase [Clostridiales bacterium]|nr:Gfo/Idh/MocA family oxidoreductase [Clostridiales bacterium]
MSVKWGVLGTANIAKGCTIPGMKDAINCELYAIAGRNEAKVVEYKDSFGFEKGYVGYEKLLEDPEVQAVYIPLPNHLHKEWVIKALKAGKHVLCEKPLALNAEDAKEMFAVAKENNLILMEAYAYLHTNYVSSLKNDIDSGVIGDVDFIETAFYTQGYVDDIRIHKSMGGGAIYDLGCYCTTMILSLIDSKIDQVMASAEFNDEGADLMASVLLKFKNGTRAAFNVGMVFDPSNSGRLDRLYIHGTKGTIVSDVEYNQSGRLSYTIKTGTKEYNPTVNAAQNYMLEIEQLGRCVEVGEEQHITPEFSIRNAELLDMILKHIGY